MPYQHVQETGYCTYMLGEVGRDGQRAVGSDEGCGALEEVHLDGIMCRAEGGEE